MQATEAKTDRTWGVRDWLRSLSLLIVLLTVTACGGGEASEQAGAAPDEAESQSAPDSESGPTEAASEPTEVTSLKVGAAATLRPSQFQLYLPDALGFWEEEGLEVEVLVFNGNSEMLQANLSGRTNASSAATAPLFDAVASGQPVTAIFTNYTSSFYTVNVFEDSPIQTMQDLRGKTIGVHAAGAGNQPQIEAMLAAAGVDPSEVEFAPVGTGEEALAFYESGRVDALALWDAQYYYMEHVLGHPLRALPSSLLDELGFVHAVSTTESDLEENGDALTGLLRGISKARVFAEENPEAAAALYYDMFPDQRPAGVSLEEAIENSAGEIEARMAFTQPVDGIPGYSTPEQVEAAMNLLVEVGGLEEPVDPGSVFTDELLAEANDFDEQAVREMAQNFELP